MRQEHRHVRQERLTMRQDQRRNDHTKTFAPHRKQAYQTREETIEQA